MKTCPVCQADLNNEAVKCTVCDTDLRTVLEMEQYLAGAVHDLPHIPSENRVSKRVWYLLPLLILFLLAGWFAHEMSGKYFTAQTAGGDKSHSTAVIDKTPDPSPPKEDIPPPVAESTPKPEKTPEISTLPRNRPEPAPAPPNKQAEMVAKTSKHLSTLVEQISNQAPSGVKVFSSKGGIYIEGAVQYSWQKGEMEQIARGRKCDFIDTTGLKIISPHAIQYRIRNGDNLSKLAEKFIGKQSAWLDLYEINQDVLSDPNKLEIGQQIVVYTKMPD